MYAFSYMRLNLRLKLIALSLSLEVLIGVYRLVFHSPSFPHLRIVHSFILSSVYILVPISIFKLFDDDNGSNKNPLLTLPSCLNRYRLLRRRDA